MIGRRSAAVPVASWEAGSLPLPFNATWGSFLSLSLAKAAHDVVVKTSARSTVFLFSTTVKPHDEAKGR
jgi:hypothetical protein